MIKKICLVLLICMFIVGLAILGTSQLVSGNGENQKKGLENAFSMALQGTAKITTLHSFNLVPQFNIDVEGLNVEGMPQNGTFSADKLHIAFGLLDLSLGTRKIEVFAAQNIAISKGIIADAPLAIETAKIVPSEDQKTGEKYAVFAVKGKIAKAPLSAELSMLAHEGSRPSYSLDEKNNFFMTLGNVAVKGIYAPFKADTKTIGDFHLSAYGSDCFPPQDTWLSNKDFMSRVIVPATLVSNKGDWILYCTKIEEQN